MKKEFFAALIVICLPLDLLAADDLEMLIAQTAGKINGVAVAYGAGLPTCDVERLDLQKAARLQTSSFLPTYPVRLRIEMQRESALAISASARVSFCEVLYSDASRVEIDFDLISRARR